MIRELNWRNFPACALFLPMENRLVRLQRHFSGPARAVLILVRFFLRGILNPI